MKPMSLIFLLLLVSLLTFVGCGHQVARETTATTAVARYICPMHPQITSTKPGSCSICGMDLVLVKESAGGIITVTPATRQQIGLTLGTVEKRTLVREIRAPARIVANETKLYHVNVKVTGWVKKLFVATTGQFVRAGEPLLTI
ncbi:MAG: heavy metal-binding domain-containing protein, partial [Verrucomicrobiota bacterium]